MTEISFHHMASDGLARRACLKTAHGDVQTPAFMPVGTAASVKALYPDQVKQAGSDIILGNTYHLMLRPGAQRVKRLGGLRRFMRWDGPILTDSGGFQVWSLKGLRKLEENGIVFRSHIDGSEHRLTPESATAIQADMLGSDISMQLDECTPHPVSHTEAARSMHLSLRWAKRCKAAFGHRSAQALFGIVQGSVYPDLRTQSAHELMETGFDGYAIGGLAVGEGHDAMCEVLQHIVPQLPPDKPRYLMGVGKPRDIVAAVLCGVDMFDCVLPTRSGRHGQAWTWAGPINLKNACFAEDDTPLDPTSSCPASRDWSKAYLHHLFKTGEYLGPMLLSWHNIGFFQALMQRLRLAISENRLAEECAALQAGWS